MTPGFITAMLAAVLALGTIRDAGAQAYPSRPVRLVVGFAAGGGTDLVARAIGPRLADALGQPFVVENKPGASGLVSGELVAKAPPDGYTILVTAAGILTIAPNLSATPPFDPLKDFEHIALIVTSPFVLVTNPSVPAKTLVEFNALAKARPASINFGSAGIGGAPHLAGELYKRLAGVDIVHVPYKGLAPALTDLLGGQIQAVFADVNLVLKHVEAGKLKALAVTGSRRFSVLPDVPTVAEAGVAGYRAETWYGLSAPAGTPAAIVARLHAEVRKAIATPELQAQFIGQGLVPATLSSAEYAALVREDHGKWAKLIKEANIQAN